MAKAARANAKEMTMEAMREGHRDSALFMLIGGVKMYRPEWLRPVIFYLPVSPFYGIL